MNTLTSSLEFSHFPVMLSEIIQIASPEKGGLFIDCTFGGGSYSNALLKFPKTKVIGIDRDEAVISRANELQKKYQKRFKFYQIKFSELDKILNKNADTIIFDLGLSSIQLKNLNRGFSFKSKNKLDMAILSMLKILCSIKSLKTNPVITIGSVAITNWYVSFLCLTNASLLL